jgi:hypothetical protein
VGKFLVISNFLTFLLNVDKDHDATMLLLCGDGQVSTSRGCIQSNNDLAAQRYHLGA